MSKPFVWSFSRLRNYQTCPKRMYHVDIAKEYKEEESEAMQWGHFVHTAMKNRIMKDEALPLGTAQYEPIAVDTLRRSQGGRIYAEQKLGMTRDFGPAGFFDGSVWLRVVVDLLVVKGNVALAIDWKTGRKSEEESIQLGLNAAAIFAHQPDVHAVRTEYHWLAGGEPTRRDFKREHMSGFWSEVIPDVAVLEDALKTTTFPARPSGICRRFCPVRSCPHYGSGG